MEPTFTTKLIKLSISYIMSNPRALSSIHYDSYVVGHDVHVNMHRWTCSVCLGLLGMKFNWDPETAEIC